MRVIAGFICALVLLAVAAYVYGGAFDVAASTPHSTFERSLFSATMKHSVVVMASGVPEPPPFADDMIRDGFGHYDDMCTICHGGPGP